MSDSLFSPWVEITNTPLPVDGSGVTQPVSGTIAVSNFPAIQPVSGTVTVSSVSGIVQVQTATASTATITQITSTGSSQTLLASNANRKSAIVYVANSTCYIAFGTTAASASNFTYQVSSNGTTIIITGWTGQINLLQTTAGKLITVTELV